MILNDNDNDSGKINADVRFYKGWKRVGEKKLVMS